MQNIVLLQIEYGSYVYNPPLNSTSCKTIEKLLRLFTKLVRNRCCIPYSSYLDILVSLTYTLCTEEDK